MTTSLIPIKEEMEADGRKRYVEFVGAGIAEAMDKTLEDIFVAGYLMGHHAMAKRVKQRLDELTPTWAREKERCEYIIDIDTMGAQYLGQCELPKGHTGNHRSNSGVESSRATVASNTTTEG